VEPLGVVVRHEDVGMPPSLNRLLVLVTPKAPFAEWAARADPKDKSPPTLADVRRESTFTAGGSGNAAGGLAREWT
jgi:hypothetical protein